MDTYSCFCQAAVPTTAESGNPSFWIAGRAGDKATALEAGHVVTWGRIAIQFVRSPIASPPSEVGGAALDASACESRLRYPGYADVESQEVAPMGAGTARLVAM